jgi:tetratricopeptide (TPR) repeat protein
LQYDTERALADVDQAIQFDSKQSFPYHVRGLIFQDRKDFDKAIADYTITIEKCSEQYSSAYQDRAKCYQSRNLPQDQDRAKTDFEKARRLLQSRVDRDPKSALLLVDRADYYMDRDDFINALTDCNAAISLNPKQISAYNLRALVRTDRTDGLRNDSELEKAIQDASKCIEMAPKATVFRTTRARIYFFHSEPTKCIDDCDFAIKLNSNNWLAYNLRGLARQDLVVTDHPRSLEDFNKSIQLNPYEAQLYANRGEQNVLMKQFREAATDYRQAVKLRPRDMRFHTELCLALYDGGSFADCVLACDAAVRVDPKSHSLFHLRGLARNKATPNKLDEVIADMDEAIRLNDRIAGYFADRGTFYFHKKDYKKATTDCNEAIRLDPNDAGAYNVRALCLYESGSDDWKSMLADYDKAIQLKPQNIIFLRNRALAYETRNEPGDAARARADRDKADEIEDKKK